ncbi:MAG: MBG domain-containing protein [Kiritimatiellae bacterium]|nr:MBG domain-containing protein [Kiritimatiellia bacterium]
MAKTPQASLIFTPATPQTYATTNALTSSGGSGTGLVSYAVLSGGGAIVDDTMLTITTGTGTVVVAASKSGDDLFLSTASTSDVVCAKANQTITFPVVSDVFWTNTVTLLATSDSELAVSYTVLSGPANVTGDELTMDGYGAVSVQAVQTGNDNFNAASPVTNDFSALGPEFILLGTNGAAIESGGDVSVTNGTKFNPVLSGYSFTNTFSLTNSGNALLTILGYETNGADAAMFTVSGVPETLAVDGVAEITVEYSPVDAGDHTAFVVFTCDETNTTFTLNLAGSCFQVSTNAGPYAGGNSLAVTNGDFGAITNVLVDGVQATLGAHEANWFIITVPPATGAGLVDMLVQTSDHGEIPLANAYTYNPAGEISVPTILMDYRISFYGNNWPFDVYRDVAYPTNHCPDGEAVYTHVNRTNDWMELASTNVGVPFKNGVWIKPFGFNNDGRGGWNDAAGGSGWIATNAAQWLILSTSLSSTNWVTVTNLPGTNYQVDVVNSYGGSMTFNETLHAGPWVGGDAPGTNWGRNAGAWQNAGGGGNGLDVTNAYGWGDRYITWSNVTPTDKAMTLSLWSTNEFPRNVLNCMRIRGSEPLGIPVDPPQGSWTGGYEVVISGLNLGNGNDITNVTLFDVAATIKTQTATRVWVTAGSIASGGVGNVVIHSVEYGMTVRSNAYTYIAAGMNIIGTNGALIGSTAPAEISNGTTFKPTRISMDFTHTFSITNTGNDALVISGCTTNGTGASAFVVSGVPETVPGEGVADFTVTYHPEMAGNHSAYLLFTGDDPNLPFTMNLYGSCYAMSTNTGPLAGGNKVTISNGTLGSNDINSVTVGGVEATIEDQGESWVRIQMPQQTGAGTRDIVIYSPLVGTTVLEGAYAVNPAGYIGNPIISGWNEVPGLPAPRCAGGFASLNSYAYWVGGSPGNVNGATTSTNVYQFDGAHWTEVAGLPVSRSQQALCTYGNAIYSLGGRNSGGQWSTNVYRFDGTSWSEVRGLPSARLAGAATVYSNDLYFVGGGSQPGDACSNACRYNGSVWVEVEAMPVGMKDLAVAVLNGRMMAFGGSGLTNVYAFDGTHWDAAEGLPEARQGVRGIVSGHSLYALGGSNGVAQQTVWSYNGTNWHASEALTYASYDGGAASINDSVYAVQGTDLLEVRTNVLEATYVGDGMVSPNSGSYTGGTQILIYGNDLGARDVTNVTICGIQASLLVDHSPTEIAVQVQAVPDGMTGDVVVYSTSYGMTVASNAFTYTASSLVLLGTNGEIMANGDAADSEKGSDFGSMSWAQCVTNVFRITNAGTEELVISGVATGGSGAAVFQVLNMPTAVAVGTASNFSVVFDPTNVAFYAATLTLGNNGTNTPYVLHLQGTGERRDQSITFPNPGPQETTNQVVLTYSAESGMMVTCVVVSGNAVLSGYTNLTFTGEGPVVLTADQAGDANWNSASTVTNTFSVTKAVASVSFNHLSQTYTGTARTVTATTVPAGKTVNITYDGNSWAPTNAGTYAITGTINEVMYQGVNNATLTVAQAAQTITFTPPGAQETTNVVGLSVSASSGLTVTCRVVSGSAVITGYTNLTFTGDGTVFVAADQSGSLNYYAAESITNSFPVTKAVASVIFSNLNQTYDGTARTVTAATLPAGKTVNVTYDGNSWAPTNAGTYAITGTIDEVMYQGVNNVTLTVARAVQVITFTSPGAQDVTNTIGLTAAGGASGNSVTYQVSEGPGIITSLTNLSFSGSGLVKVTADQLGNANYDAASTVTNEILVNAVIPAISDSSVTNVESVTALFGATVTATNGASITERGVFLGTSNTFDMATARRDSETGTWGTGRFTVAASNLWTGVTNYYRGFAVNSAGTNVTAVDYFLTKPAAPEPTGATNQMYDRLYANWQESTGATNYYFDVTNSAGYLGAYSNLLLGDVTTMLVTGLEPGVVYAYRLRAENSVGISTNCGWLNVMSAAGSIELSPTAMTFHAVYAGTNPPPQNWTVKNTGIFAFDYTNSLSYGAGASGWLSDSAGGTIVTGAMTTWTTVVHTAGINAGTWYATNSVSSQVATNSPQMILVTLEVEQGVQTITFDNPGTQETTNQVGLPVSASSGLAVTCEVVSGSASITGCTNLVFSGAGSVTIAAHQAGDSNWYGAASMTQTFAVTKAVASVMLTNLTQTYNGSARSVGYVTSPTGLTVDITYNSSATAPTNAGSYTVIGTVSNVMYQGGATGTLVVARANQTIDFPEIDPQDSTNTTGLSATSASGLPVSFSVVSGNATLSDQTNLSYQSDGTVWIAALQPGDTNWNAAPMATNSITVNKSAQGALVFTPPSPQVYRTTNLLGTSGGSGTGAVSYAVGSGPGAIVGVDGLIINSGSGVVTVVATKALDDMYGARAVTAQVYCARAYQTIDFPTIGKQRVTNTVGLSATASSGLGMMFSVASGPGAINGGTNLTFTEKGRVVIQAYQGGDTNWNEAWATQDVVVAKAAIYLDFDGDGKADATVFWPEAGQWNILKSSDNTLYQQVWGWANSTPVAGDYDGDGKYDVAVYNATYGMWYILQSETMTGREQAWGWENAWAVPGDYDGDGLSDVAVYDSAAGAWHILQSSTGIGRTEAWGWPDAVPAPGDYDGDGLTDCAVYWPEGGEWYILQSSTDAGRIQPWGWPDAQACQGDFDGDGKTDIAVYWEEPGWWNILQSSDGQQCTQSWGWSRAVPVPADYDGDEKFDVTVYWPNEGMWYIWQSATQTMRTQPWGFEEAYPVR